MSKKPAIAIIISICAIRFKSSNPLYYNEHFYYHYLVAHVGELIVFYTDIQKTFADRLKEFRNQFEMILEGEKTVAGAKTQLEVSQEKETRLRKEVKRAAKKPTELRDWTEKLNQAEREKDLVNFLFCFKFM